jgi:5-methylcytosine-specific restriction protein A
VPTRPKTHAQLQRASSPPETRREERGTAAERGYGYRWQKARATFLRRHPLCLYCQRQGRTAVATVVDHAVPHKGDQAKFWDTAIWTPACRACHQHVTIQYDGGHGRPELPRDGYYVPPTPGELGSDRY